MAGGIAGLDVLNMIKDHLNDNLTTGAQVETIWKEKSVGFGDSSYDQIFIGLDAENVNIYSLQHSQDGMPRYDWLHNVHFFVTIHTAQSEERVLELANDVMRVAKESVIVPFDRLKYIQLIPTGATSLNDEFRNLFRYELTFKMMVFNP